MRFESRRGPKKTKKKHFVTWKLINLINLIFLFVNM